ncbi:MAG: response regulator [Sedimentisphaerales bacterium]|nr:response regulator [Sedimentisphaerales bacterium]
MSVECKKILILDPNTIDVFRLYSDLLRNGFDVETCCSLQEAVERIKNIDFDCIVMDVDIPKIKGYDAVSIIKAVDPQIKIIMTSERNDLELETEVRKQDISYYHIKSFDRQELVEAVRDVCQ